MTSQTEMIGFNEYQRHAHKTAVYPREKAVSCVTLDVVSEAGELASKVKKILRDKAETAEDAFKFDTGDMDLQDKFQLATSVGSVLWGLAEICTVLDLNLETIAADNLSTLAGRATRGTLKGDGDKR